MRDYLDELVEHLKDTDKAKARREILAKIAEKWNKHDFAVEILDDRWHDVVRPEAMSYLTSDEVKALVATATEEEDNPDVIARWGEHVVLRAFVLHLCRYYNVGPRDLGGLGE